MELWEIYFNRFYSRESFTSDEEYKDFRSVVRSAFYAGYDCGYDNGQKLVELKRDEEQCLNTTVSM